MAPYGGLANTLPVLNRFFQWFMGDHLKIEGGLFRLHHKATSFLVLIGFCFISVENFSGGSTIQCHYDKIDAYSRQFCWIHGYSYLKEHLQGNATGCYVDQTKLKSEADGPVTNYYLWLPYLMSLLFIIIKLPHILWKKFLENNLIRHILGGEDLWPDLFIGPRNNGGGDGGNEGGGKKGGGGGGDNNGNQQGQGEGKKGKNKGKQGNQGKRFKISKETEIGKYFVANHKKCTMYQIKYAWSESLNILSILLCIQITDWVLNSQFWSYGLNVIHYLNVYQDRATMIHDPMCQVFPTEVACKIVTGAASGGADDKNFLCILGNNVFNQKYFFALWLWWMMLLGVFVLGFIFRLFRLAFPLFSRLLLIRKVHGNQLSGLILTSGECFVLELVIDNLTHVPIFTSAVLKEIAANMKEISYRRLNSQDYHYSVFHDYNDGATPLLKEEEIDYDYQNHHLSPKLDKDHFKNGNAQSNIKELKCCQNFKDNKEMNVAELLKIDPEPSTTPCEKMKAVGENGPVQDNVVEVNEISKPASKKKKNKKNVKLSADCQEEKNKTMEPIAEEPGGSSPASAMPNVEDDSENDGCKIRLGRVDSEDKTVISFPSATQGGDWI